ncbi:hypothetical protein AVEN_15590-1 [Araneus ventricosus]|uniref:Uncharacterized protein n=1 Tax=Araneus ventricosus TaxID=182803 RepID=A0A4Y2X3N9_ARAVE|nr:hypothetical protein AVEN_15590-1 [Araneus ventricosus]
MIFCANFDLSPQLRTVAKCAKFTNGDLQMAACVRSQRIETTIAYRIYMVFLYIERNLVNESLRLQTVGFWDTAMIRSRQWSSGLLADSFTA